MSLRVALVTSEGRCGIAEHSLMLREHVQMADSEIEFVSDPRWLDPAAGIPGNAHVVHLNYHRGLHSRWLPGHVEQLRAAHYKIVITFHDTYETQPDRLAWDLLDVCDAMIVHEPCDLQDPELHKQRALYQDSPTRPRGIDFSHYDAGKVHYWRQGVPQPSIEPATALTGTRPYVGTCGFAFPWKGFELLCDAARLAGWGVLILSHNATDEQVADWKRRNPWAMVGRQYLSTPEMIAALQQCDATAFLYSCANSGTSGAIRLGIAAGKQVIASQGCRQFRDLTDEQAIAWTEPTVEKVAEMLKWTLVQRFHPLVVELRERDSWEHLGQKYAALYRSLVTR